MWGQIQILCVLLTKSGGRAWIWLTSKGHQALCRITVGAQRDSTSSRAHAGLGDSLTEFLRQSLDSHILYLGCHYLSSVNVTLSQQCIFFIRGTSDPEGEGEEGLFFINCLYNYW